MRTIQDVQQKDERLAIGLISGTSLDGVDAALVRIKNAGLETKVELLFFMTFPYPKGLKEKLLEISTPGKGTVDRMCRYNVVLGEIFADAIKALLEKAGVSADDVDFIGSHGQTVHHLPKPKNLFGYSITSTLQLGEPSVIAKRAGILTVADFRPADMARGGEGAPLVPYLDFTLFRSLEKSRALLNIGGIANFTVLKKECSLNDVIAFDSGPGNMVIDFLMSRLFSRPFDKNGEIASSGEACEELLLKFALTHPYFKKRPPKSTGREEFGAEFGEKMLAESERLGLNKEDIITTATEVTVRSVIAALKNFVSPEAALDEIIVSGGGSENQYIMEGLAAAGAVLVKPSDEYGIPSAAKEAILFALLANETICGNPSNVPSATGASAPTVLGKICF